MHPHRLLGSISLLLLLSPPGHLAAADLPRVTAVELQPLTAQVHRLVEALDFLGAPLPETDKQVLRAASSAKGSGTDLIQAVLDKHCLVGVRILPGKSKVALRTLRGAAKPELAERGWRVFLIKVYNEAGLAHVKLKVTSPNGEPMVRRATNLPDPKVVSVGEVGQRFLELSMYDSQPLLPCLSGLELEYRILLIYCRDAGRKEALLGFHLLPDDPQKKPGQTSTLNSDLVPYLFDSAPAVLVRLRVRDQDGKPAMAAFTIKDSQGRIYPAPNRRLAPDFFFHPQVYRADGETLHLQPGPYNVTCTRGPEYLTLTREISVPPAATHDEAFELRRWIHPAAQGWYSGDHHIHAAGCSHYDSPTEGVTPADMMRHILGEDLDVGCCLSWGPCWYYQKRYFEGKVNALSTAAYLLRYDVEVSGFPSSHCGHLCLLGLHEQDYPGTKLIDDWPSWDLPILRWAKAQGAVVGFAHSGWGLAPEKPDDPAARQLPNYLPPMMDGIGANEYIVDVAHGACDFISTVDTPANWELNAWYHTLNCGYRTRISGETDFPCIYGERVGLGRSYVHVDGPLQFDDWVQGIKAGRCYVSDGLSHLMDFSVNGLEVGRNNSEVHLPEPGKVKIQARVAALLEARPTPETERIRNAPTPVRGKFSNETFLSKPYWHAEKARVGNTRNVPVELVLNGYPVAHREVLADGNQRQIKFEVPIDKSGWVCLRIFPSSHTNPVFVLVDGKPVRASKRSAEWCLKAIDNCWANKAPHIRLAERPMAEKAYDEARAAYRKILTECAEE
jgi:hypothetical protein